MTIREDESTWPFWVESLTGASGGEALITLRLGLAESWLETQEDPVVGLELLQPGTRIGAGESLGFLHLATRTEDLRAPFALELLKVNEAALNDARLVRSSAYSRGWLVEVRSVD